METINNTADNSEGDSDQGFRRTRVTADNRNIFLFIKKKIILTITSLLTLVALPQNVFSQASVTTDKLDYIPGEYVQISGAHWQAGENVQMIIMEEPIIEGHDTVNAVADASGNIFNNQYMIAANDIGQSFTLTATGQSSGLVAKTQFTDGVDFRQSANEDAGYGIGNIHWINSILQNGNSKYYEGMSSLQRVILTSVGSSTGNVHTLTFSHQSVKSAAGSHAYDFMTSWPQGQVAADAIAVGQGLMTTINQCGPEPSSDPGGILALCAALHSSGFFATPSIPDAMGTTLGDNVATRVAAYEAVFGDRTLKIYGNAAITSASVSFDGYTGTDLDANYTLTWTSSSSSIIVEFAGHLGVGEDPLLAGIGYGTGKGAGAIPGGPYHVHLNSLDGHNLGSQDNQIKAADILIPPPICNITGPSSACAGATNLSYVGPSGTGFSYAWVLTTANGATFCSATNSQTVCVNAGSGSFTLQVTVTGPGGSTTCDKAVTITPPPVCSINDPLNSGGLPGITCNSPGGSPNNTISTSNVAAGNTYTWTILSPPSGWSITSGQGTNEIHFTSGVCAASVTVQLTITDANGCVSTCTKVITPNPFVSSCDANAGADMLLNCTVTTVTLSGSTLTPSSTADDGTVYPSTYSWAGPGIVSGGNTLNPVVNAQGIYTLSVTVFPGVGGDIEHTCTDTVSVNQNINTPTCSISGVDPTCTVLSNNYSGPDAPQGKSYSYSWTLTGEVNASVSGSISGQTVTVISGTCNASYTLHLKVTDQSNGCFSECDKAFGFEDKTPPTIGAAGDNATINCPAEPNFTAPLANDACGTAQVVLLKDTTIGTACNYVRTKTWKAVDACGNSSDPVSQSITVHDVTNPTIGAAGSNTVINCPAEPQFTAPQGQDECSTAQIVLVKDTTIGTACNYVRTKTWKAVDACGNSSDPVSQSITVHDVTNPTIGSAGSNTVINCPAEPQFTAPQGQDECSTAQIVLVKDTTIGTACNYVRTKTWKAVDACGNSSDPVSQSITLHDVTNPTIGSAGANSTIDCPNKPEFTAPQGQDECSSVNIILVKDTTIGNGCNYVRTKTWKAVDACGNSSDPVSQSITVHDITNPTIGSAGANTTINCPFEPQFTAPLGEDLCSAVQIVLVKDTTIGNACSYVRTKTWKAVDACGNSSNTVSQSITVHDVTAPVLSGEGADMTLDDCKGTVSFSPPTATDACSANPVVHIVRTDTILNTNGSITYKRYWNATDDCQNTSSQVDQAITVPICTHEFCSLTQGFYGSGKGVACATGERGNVLIVRLLSSPFGNLVIGKSGRSLTIDAAHAGCIIARLPAGGKPIMLPSGNETFTSDCATSVLVDSRGKFVNVLLGQTITLGLNMRLDPNLGALILKGSALTTVGSNKGADGICGTTDDTPNSGTLVTKTIPASVLNALASLYTSRSVANLFDLANRGLGGMSTGGASLSDINQAVDAINEGFDGCRFLQTFGDGIAKETEAENVSIMDDQNITLKAIPNPFSSSTILEFTSKTDAKAVVEVYNVEGAKVATLFSDDVKADDTHSVIFRGDGFADGIYIYRVTTGSKSYYQKLILAK